MRQTSTTFDSYHDLSYKTPMYLIHFDGKTTDYVNHLPSSSTNTCKKYIVSIKGASQKVRPEEGRASIGGTKISILDKDNEITSLIANDTYQMQRKKVIIKAGYVGMKESDMLTIQTGWVTGLPLNKDGLVWEFDITDPLKWLQRKVFRDATEDSPVTVAGNPINILLAVLTSTGNGTNGDYDYLGASEGLGLDETYIDVTGIENVRDQWFSGLKFSFTIVEKIQAKKWIEEQICKVLNVYPVIDSQGRITIKPFKPPLAALDTVQSFDESNIIGLPQFDMNFSDLINEVEFHYDYDSSGGSFDTEDYYIDATSLNNRGPGKQPLKIEAKGITSANQGSYLGELRKNRVFQRYSIPPVKLNLDTHFSRWLTEAGDIVPVTHSKLPNLDDGTRGFSETRMEVINRTIDWSKGKVKLELLNTGFQRNVYGVLSPYATVTACTSTNTVQVSTADGERFSTGDIVKASRANGKLWSTGLTITQIDSSVARFTFSPAMTTQATTGFIIEYADYDAVDGSTNKQDLYCYISDSTSSTGDGTLGNSSDLAHLIVA